MSPHEKRSLVDLMFAVQGGHVSCRRAASIIMERTKMPKGSAKLADSFLKFRRKAQPTEWNLPVPPVDFTKSTFHFSINYTVWMGNASLCFCDRKDHAEWVARAFNGWLQTEDGKKWLTEMGFPNTDDLASLATASGSASLFQCPKCDGPHFNVGVDGTLVCASVSQHTDYKVKHGGCGWRGTLNTERSGTSSAPVTSSNL